jgi:hypothetical protein
MDLRKCANLLQQATNAYASRQGKILRAGAVLALAAASPPKDKVIFICNRNAVIETTRAAVTAQDVKQHATAMANVKQQKRTKDKVN